MPTHHIYLIPGFFGFANFGDLKYFSHVREQLDRRFDEAGVAVEIHYVPTLPTAALPRRAARLLEVIVATAGRGRGPIHLVGHSTGGLDARLLLAPGTTLPAGVAAERWLDRVRTAVSIATPHWGTPLASTFSGVAGRSLLRAISTITIHTIRLGGVPLPAAVMLVRALTLRGRALGLRRTMFEQVYQLVLRDFSPERREQLSTFFAEVGEDHTLLGQLTPEAMQLLGARATRRTGVRYGCVVTRAKPPRLGAVLELGLRPLDQTMYSAYRVLHEACARTPRTCTPELDETQRSLLSEAFGSVPDRRDNDAIVPTRSQLFGRVIHAAWADHHDVIGHFDDPSCDPPHVDWLRTLSRFSRSRFEALWASVADVLVGEDA